MLEHWFLPRFHFKLVWEKYLCGITCCESFPWKHALQTGSYCDERCLRDGTSIEKTLKEIPKCLTGPLNFSKNCQ